MNRLRFLETEGNEWDGIPRIRDNTVLANVKVVTWVGTTDGMPAGIVGMTAGIVRDGKNVGAGVGGLGVAAVCLLDVMIVA